MPKPKKTRPAAIEAFLRRISSTASAITGESITNAAGAAGTVQNFVFAVAPIANAAGTDLGSVGDTSIALTHTAFTTEVLPKADADLANGEYYVDYLTGKARGKKATTATSGTANYTVFSIMTNITGNEAVKITDGTDEAEVEASGADAVSNTRGSLSVGARLSGFNGTTWDRLRAGITAVTSTLTGWLNTLPWAVYNTTPTTRTNGQGGPLQASEVGSLMVQEANRPGFENNARGIAKTETQLIATNITASTLIRTGAGVFAGIVVNSASAGATVKVWDNTSAASTVLNNTVTFTSAVNEGTKMIEVPNGLATFATGLYVSITGTIDITVYHAA